MNGTVADMLAVARRNLGVVEGKNNDNIYAAVAGHANNAPWCATFLVACARRAGVKLGNESAWTPALRRSLSLVSRDDARPGDLMFIFFPSLRRVAHVGVVEAVFPTFVITIEGNTDEAGGRTGGKVMRKKRAYKNLSFARPVYRKPKPPARPVKRKPDPILRIGNRGQLVLNVQRALVKHGGRVSLDGDFGPATKRAVINFQKKRGLKADGVVGQCTWDALRKAPR